MNSKEFLKTGWAKFPVEDRLVEWLDAVQDQALATADDPEFAEWHRHGNTWFAGVNALPNDETGAVAGGPPLACGALDLAHSLYGDIALDPAQVSIVYPGYPKQGEDESSGAYRFRKLRDAAHVDGLKPTGPERRRFLDECHGFILGLPLRDVDASPLVVWEGSHELVRDAFWEAFRSRPPQNWAKIEVTEFYEAVRRDIFDQCDRIEIPAKRGEAILVHRLCLHGVAPWGDSSSEEDRPILYFRPPLSGGPKDWLGFL